MSGTTRFGLPLLSAAQAQKHITHNEALNDLDAVVNAYAFGFITAPSGSESDGAAYIVASGGTGVFDGWDGSLVYRLAGFWVPVPPTEGLCVWLQGEQRFYVYHAGAWVPASRPIASDELDLYVASNGSDTTGTGKETATKATVTFTNSSTHIGWTAHGRSVGDLLVFTSTGALPTNFTDGKPVYVKTVIDANTLEVANTAGGTAISAASAGTGTQTGTLVSPVATVLRAQQIASAYDANGFDVIVYVAGGSSYSENVVFNADDSPIGCQLLAVFGDTDTPIAGFTFTTFDDVKVHIDGFATSFSANGHSEIDLTASHIDFPGTTVDLYASDHAKITALGMIERISTNKECHLLATDQSIIDYRPTSTDLIGTPAFSDAYAQASYGALITAQFWQTIGAVTGTGTGVKHSSYGGGKISTLGDDFPGDTPGDDSLGGYFD